MSLLVLKIAKINYIYNKNTMWLRYFEMKVKRFWVAWKVQASKRIQHWNSGCCWGFYWFFWWKTFFLWWRESKAVVNRCPQHQQLIEECKFVFYSVMLCVNLLSHSSNSFDELPRKIVKVGFFELCQVVISFSPVTSLTLLYWFVYFLKDGIFEIPE